MTAGERPRTESVIPDYFFPVVSQVGDRCNPSKYQFRFEGDLKSVAIAFMRQAQGQHSADAAAERNETRTERDDARISEGNSILRRADLESRTAAVGDSAVQRYAQLLACSFNFLRKHPDDGVGERLVVWTRERDCRYLSSKLFGRKSAAICASPAHACDFCEQFRIFIEPRKAVRRAGVRVAAQHPLLKLSAEVLSSFPLPLLFDTRCQVLLQQIVVL